MTDILLGVGIFGTTNELGDAGTFFQGSVTFCVLQSKWGKIVEKISKFHFTLKETQIVIATVIFKSVRNA